MAGDPAELLPPLDFKHPGVPLRNYSGHQESIISAGAMDSSEHEQIRQMMESGDLDILKNQLDDFNKHMKSEFYASSGPENVNDSYFFDFLVSKGIDTSEALT